MSLQKVFETARTLGLPILLTDINASAPFVIMTLEQFEKLTSAMPKMATRSNGNPKQDSAAAPTSPQGFSEDRARRVPVPVTQPSPQAQPLVENDMPLEERFYFEPLEDAGQ